MAPGRHGQGIATRLRPAVDWLIPALVVATPLAIGTVHPATRTSAFVLSAAALLAVVAERREAGRRVQITVPMLVLALVCAGTALQLVPLPWSWLAALSPRAAYFLSQTVGPGGVHPISLEPAATSAELAKGLGYFAFLAATTNYAGHASCRRRLMIAVVLAGVGAALLGFIQAAANARIWFFYVPRAEILNEILVRGPFVNPNHFGALMGLAAPCALALYLREPELRVRAALALVVLNVGAVTSLSRAAILVVPAAQAVTFGLDWWQARACADTGRAGRGARVAVVVVAIAAVVSAIAVGGTRATRSLAATASVELRDPFGDPQSKFQAWSRSLTLVGHYPWTGVGRGAFEQAYGPLNQHGGSLRYAFVENGYLQLVVDFGVPLAALLLVLSGFGLLVAFRRHASDSLAIGAIGALVGLAVHEVADFAVEVPGIGFPALALIAVIFARRRAETGSDAGRLVPASRWLFLVPAIVVAWAFVTLGRADAEREGKALTLLARDPGVTAAAVLVEGEQARRRHPADFYITALVAERLAKDGHPDALRWLNDAILLNPTHPTLHVIAGEYLARRGHKGQALLELRTAVAYSAEGGAIWDRVASRWPEVDALIAATPQEPGALAKLAYYLTGKDRFADADLVSEHLIRRDPGHLVGLQLRVRLAIRLGKGVEARARAAKLLRVDQSPESRRWAARGYIAGQDLDGARQVLDQTGGDRSPATFAVELELAEALAADQRRPEARARLDALTWVKDRSMRIALHKARAALERLDENEHQYRWELEQAKLLEDQ
jgi:hypothetical protein